MGLEHYAAGCSATCFFSLQKSNVHDTSGHDASLAFYWPNQQYYVSGHNNHSAELPSPVVPSTKNVQVKNNMPMQIFRYNNSVIEQRVTMGFPCPAYKARCPMTAQPPRQIIIMQTGSISTSKSIDIGPSDDVYFVF
jgi:hypothetical protein